MKLNYFKDDDYLDLKIIELIKFLTKSKIVNLKCLENIDSKKIIRIRCKYDYFYAYYDFDFIDEDAYLNFKLYNKLTTNPKLNLLIGNVVDEDSPCGNGCYKPNDKYYVDQFTAPIISKEKAKEFIKNSSILFKGPESFIESVTNYYTNETKWELKRGYIDSFINLNQDLSYLCPLISMQTMQQLLQIQFNHI